MTIPLLQQAADAYRRGRFDEAESLAVEAVRADPTDEQAVLMYSGLLLHRQATQEARALLEGALSQGLESEPARADLALCCHRLGDYPNAERLARLVTENQPALISGWNALGSALLAMKEFESAEGAMVDGLVVHADHPALTLLLGQARSALDKKQEAAEAYRAFDRTSVELVREAEDLTLSGRMMEAEQRYRQLLVAQPENASALAGLGRLLMRLDRFDEATQVFEEALRLSPEDHGSRHFLDIARGQAPQHANPAYVRSLFDSYAEDFEDNLTDSLGYRIPEEIAQRLIDYQADLGDVLDLGCGTGLMAQALEGGYGEIDGVDLSARMLALAEKRGAYRHLYREDIVNFLEQQSQQWTTVLAADVLVYVGEMSVLVNALVKRMRPGAWFAFSIELSESDGCVLNPATGRFQHHPDAVDKIMMAHGFELPRWTMTTIRQEMGDRIPGAIGLARARSA